MKNVFIAILLCVFSTPLWAKPHVHNHHVVAVTHHHLVRHHGGVHREVALTPRPRGEDGRPSAWCGWYARHNLVPIDPGTAYNLAANWRHYGHPANGPAVGEIVVWWHHVGKIVGQAPKGLWVVLSGNDGHAVRERARSVSSAIAFRVM